MPPCRAAAIMLWRCYRRRRSANLCYSVAIVHIICISIINASTSKTSKSLWHPPQRYPLPVAFTRRQHSIGVNRLYRKNNLFAISQGYTQLGCFATHQHHAPTRCTSTSTSSPIIASLFFRNIHHLWKRNRPINPIGDSVLRKVGRIPAAIVENASVSSTAYLEKLSADQNLLQTTSTATAMDRISSLSGGHNDYALTNSEIIENTNANSNNVQEDETDNKEEAEDNTILIHTYSRNNNLLKHAKTYFLDGATATIATPTTDITNKNINNLTLMGVGMSQRQFAAWVHYYLLHMTDDGEINPSAASATIASSALTIASAAIAARQPHLSKTLSQHDQSVQHVQNRESTNQILNEITQHISTQQANYDDIETWENKHVPIIREYWKNGKLICEHTSLLSGRRRNNRQDDDGEGNSSSDSSANANNGEDTPLSEEELQAKKDEEIRQYKQEQFRDVLHSYAERMATIVEDELSDAHHVHADTTNSGSSSKLNFGQVVGLPQRIEHSANYHPVSKIKTQHHTLPKWATPNTLKGWIEANYGIENTHQLMAHVLLQKSEKKQLDTFQLFLHWFRNNFPYFHDQCDSCGAACKDDPNPQSDDDVETKKEEGDGLVHNVEQGDEQQAGEGEENEDDFSFLGYVHPTHAERLGNASRTELYRCRTCSSYTRFPRYNKALWVTSTQRGRCGEYSMLLYRMLRVLGYDKVRWVVDWADHVWAEVWLGDGVHSEKHVGGGRWVHLDPCEAAVDNPLLYESWGKNQTYIVAFHDPFYMTSNKVIDPVVDRTKGTMPHDIGRTEHHELRDTTRTHCFPPVEDITRQYTSDEVHVIEERRGVADEPVIEAIEEVSKAMVTLLEKLIRPNGDKCEQWK